MFLVGVGAGSKTQAKCLLMGTCTLLDGGKHNQMITQDVSLTRQRGTCP